MAISERLGVIGGNGWLGSAIVRSAVTAGVVDPARLTLSSRSGTQGSLAGLPAHWTRDNAELADRSDVVILSVRPEQFGDIAIDLGGKLAISVMAGVSCAAIAAQTKADRIVRTLPNAAAAIGKSFTPWYAEGAVSESDKAVVRAIFAASGEEVEAPDEFHIDYCAALTGSGAAFPALLAEALKAEAVAQGLAPAFAEKAAKSLLCDATQLFAGPDGSAAAIVQEMIDYKGMIAAALEKMQATGFQASVSAGLNAALERAGRKA